jgi:MFS family permease
MKLWRYYLFCFLKDFFFISAVLIPFFTQWASLSFTQITILQSWFVLWIFLLEVPTGAVADYLGRKYSLALGGFVIAMAAVVYGSMPKFEIFLLGEFLFAMGNAFISGADQALLYDTLKETGRESESKKVFGKAHAINLFGIFVSAIIGSFIASKYGLNAPMLFSSFSFILTGIVALSMKEPVVHKSESESKRYLIIVKAGFSFFYHHKALRILAVDGILVASAAYFVIWLYQPILRNLNIPIFYFGFVHAFLVATEMIVANNFVRLEKLFGTSESFFKITALITGVSFFLVALLPNIATVVIFIICAGGFGLTRLELMSAYMNRHIPSAQRATVLSSISMFRRFVLIFLNPIVGVITDYSLSISLLFIGLLPLAVFLFSPLTKELLEGE